MQKVDTVCLRHMLDAARQAVELARGRSHTDLDRDPILALAIPADIVDTTEATELWSTQKR